MKTKFTLLASLLFIQLAVSNLKAQYFPIPDANFAAWLHTHGYDTCMVGNTLDTICSLSFHQPTNNLDLSNLGISNPAGMQYISWCAPNGSCTFKSINLSHNNLKSIPVELKNQFSSNLQIDISYNQIDTLTLGPVHYGIKSINASNNNMQVFQKDTQYTPFTIGSLNFDYNSLDSFPYFYSNGGTGYGLTIRHNQLTVMPKGNYYSLNCGANQITSAVGINSLAATIIIDSNLLTSFDMTGLGTYWDVIYKVDCSHNQITSISNVQFPSMSLNGKIGTFLCNDNNIIGSLPHLPTDIRVLDCHNNPNLTCIANLPNVTSLQLDYSNTAIQCLPRQFPNCVYNSTPSINAVPTCNMYNNIYGCPQYSNMEGVAYSDIDSNCVIDTTDWKLGYLKARFMQNGTVKQQIYTDWQGHYSFDEINYGTYVLSVDTNRLPISVHCPDSTYYTATVDSQKLYQSGFDFGMRCRNGFDVGVTSLSAPQFLPHELSNISLSAGDVSQLYGLHCAAGVSGQVTLTYSGPIMFLSNGGALTPTSVVGNTINWVVPDFGMVDIHNSFRLNFYVDSLAQLNDLICFQVSVTPTAGDINISNNSFTYCDEIHVAYDPNDKTVCPNGNIDTAQEELLYTIRFQNTGNAPARHVKLVDTLDSSIDITSFQLLGFSHQNITHVSENGLVTFNFPNINLPDSNTNEPLSHGYVQYKVKLKPNLPIGTVINNTAYIYFDFNAPVVTNTTTNTISLSTGIAPLPAATAGFTLFPNPSNSNVTISVEESLIGSTATVSDVAGRVVSTVLLSTAKCQLPTTHFGSGVYFVTVGNRTQKLIITK